MNPIKWMLRKIIRWALTDKNCSIVLWDDIDMRGHNIEDAGTGYFTIVTVGDLEFRNNWSIEENKKYGLVIVDPKGRKYKFVLEEVEENV